MRTKQRELYNLQVKPFAQESFDVAIAGGGLAGLALSIQLARMGHSVVVFEKHRYPFHRVCGEYISFESLNFLEWLGVDIKKLGASQIHKLQLSLPDGKFVVIKLPLGGFGISRYELDYMLMQIAKHSGVTVMEDTRVNDIVYERSGDCFTITTSRQLFLAKVVCATFGKRCNMTLLGSGLLQLIQIKNLITI